MFTLTNNYLLIYTKFSRAVRFEMDNTENGTNQFDLQPLKEPNSNKSCSSYPPQKFEYNTSVQKERYFAIWGCYQISEEEYDRGLWVFNVNIKPPLFDGRRIVTEALTDMRLENETGIWNKMIINEHRKKLQYDVHCKDDKFDQYCQLVDNGTEKKQWNVVVFIFICGLLGVIVIVTMGVYIWNIK